MKEKLKSYIDRLEEEEFLAEEEWEELIGGMDEDLCGYAAKKARRIADSVFGTEIRIRGIIEYTNICKNDCYYCGIRRSNSCVWRYRLTKEDIMRCCDAGWKAGFKTFVLQGGEDLFFTDAWYEDLISGIKKNYPECAVTLSLGERTRESYQRLFDAGADRYLLRHETADKAHYSMLHPKEMSYDHRMKCLCDLKEIGYETGCGFMVGSPAQTAKQLAEDMVFIRRFRPHMIGIGPFIPADRTPFASEQGGGLELTLYLLSLIRIMEKKVLLPATTALGTIHPRGRELGILAGANVIMPNISPRLARENYILYQGKPKDGRSQDMSVEEISAEEAAGVYLETDRTMKEIKKCVEGLGYTVAMTR